MDSMACSLTNLLESVGSLPEQCIQELALGIINGLKKIHSHSQNHNGLTSNQILLDMNGNVKISVGIKEKMKLPNQNENNLYQSSENFNLFDQKQAQALKSSSEGDIYDFGYILLLTALGSVEIEKTKFNETQSCCLFHRLEQSNQYIERFTRRFSKHFREILHKCLNFNRNKRPSVEKLLQLSFFSFTSNIGPNINLKELLLVSLE